MRFSVGFPLVDPISAASNYTYQGEYHPVNPDFYTHDFAAEFVQVVEDAGFDAINFTEHPIPSMRWISTGGHETVDPFVGLAFVGALSTRLRLITLLSPLPYRNPFLFAKAVASLDRFSNGRVTLGLGSGYLKSEFFALGVDFDERNDLFDEALEVCRLTWSGNSVTYEGRHFSAQDVVGIPSPLQDPVPVWVGGNSRLARRRVVDNAQGWLPQPNPPSHAALRRTAVLDTLGDLERMLKEVHVTADAQGRTEPIDVMFTSFQGGLPGTGDWDARDRAAEVRAQEGLGVTWQQISVGGSTRDEVFQMLRTYGDGVIAALR